MKKGILLIALGHPNYYAMAAVLAASIKVNDDLPVCLVTDHTVPKQHEFLYADVKAPTKKSIEGGLIKSKLFMYDFSPFDETIFLDVDQVVIEGRKLSSVFEEMKDIDFTMSNTGLAEESLWADIAEVQSLYGDQPFWNFHSEFVYFKKSPEVKKYFNAAKKVFEDNKIKSAVKFSGGNMADELALQCASIMTGIYPHKENWLPNFWYEINPILATKYPYQLADFLTYSIGGRTTPRRIKDNYNNLANYYFAKLRLTSAYQVIDKRNFLQERKLI